MIAIVAVYFVISFDQLEIVPIMYQDEPWVASVAYKLANEGIYGTDLFAGYYGMERRAFMLPVYQLLQAGVFKTIGLGVWEMRLLPVTFGALLLASESD